MPKRLSEELKDSVVFDYLSGVTTREIYKKYKTSELYVILNQRGIEYKQDNKQQKERYKKVVEMYLNNICIEDIKKETDCGDVYKVLKNLILIEKEFQKNIIKTKKMKEINN